MAKLTAAIIGCGGMGRCHLSALKAMDEVELVAACDIVEELLQKRADEFEVPKRYADMRAMLEEVKPDIVAVATQARQHRECVVACAEARVKGVLCEKPMALDLAECDAMVEACQRSGTQLAINHQGHCRPSTVVAQKMVENGDVGELILVRGVNKGGRKAGNELMEMGTHTTDRMICFGGKATWCSANITWDGRDADARDIMQAKEMNPRDRDAGLVMGHRAFALYGFTNCPIGEMYFMAWDKSYSPRGYGVDLMGSKGQLMLRGSRMDAPLYHLPSPVSCPADGEDQWQSVELPAQSVWKSLDDSVCVMYQHLVHAIETGEEHPSSGDVGRHALEMIMAIYESHRLKRRVELPLSERGHPLERWRETQP